MDDKYFGLHGLNIKDRDLELDLQHHVITVVVHSQQ